MSKKVLEEVKRNTQLCWDCEKACGRCSWSRDFIPVPGWKATPTKLNVERNRIVDSYEVHECPEFEILNIKNEDELLKLVKRNIGRIRRDQSE